MKRRILLQAGAATLAAPAVFAQATWPSGPVRIIVGFPPAAAPTPWRASWRKSFR